MQLLSLFLTRASSVITQPLAVYMDVLSTNKGYYNSYCYNYKYYWYYSTP